MVGGSPSTFAEQAMPDLAGQPVSALDTPQLLLDLDALDANLAYLQRACREAGKRLRVHFKSLKCGGLAKYLAARGVKGFLCAKLNEAEVLVEAGQGDVYVANQVVGPAKLARLARLARRAKLRVCVDDAGNVREMAAAARREGATIEVLIEVEVGMNRCGVEPGGPVLELARAVAAEGGLRFAGLQGYDGHLQLLADREEKKARCLEGLEKLRRTRELLEGAGLNVEEVTGAGTGTWEFAAAHPALTELQPGSFLLMDAAYHAVRPEFACALSVVATVISRRPAWYVLDAGSKAISQDFGKPQVKGRPGERVARLSEEHTRVEDDGRGPAVGDRREVLPAHCCATMNLHRTVVAVRKGAVEAAWPIEASGRYD
jgi:D-serine deaminase-like pyridoxal phosphate-dependent protein